MDGLNLLGHDLEVYFKSTLDKLKSNHKSLKILMNFIGISLPFCQQKYTKIMEFPCEKESQGRDNNGCIEKCLKKSILRRWQDRWVVLSNSSIMYFNNAEDPFDSVRDNVLFDKDASLSITAVSSFSTECTLRLSRRVLNLRFKRVANGLICIYYIIKAIQESEYSKKMRFNSFAPEREANDCVFFSDGIGYFREVYNAISNASQEIMICDWWFSPELPLLRGEDPDGESSNFQINHLLRRAADERDVKVYILLYSEFSYSMNNGSSYSKKSMEEISKKGNIKVMVHPSVVFVSLWSHHEKMIIVDRKIVFMGGLDLCWGRWDCNNHNIFTDESDNYFPGIDYYNPFRKDIVDVTEYKKFIIDRRDPRMPWHDVAVLLVGPIVVDFLTHFMTYWNHAKETCGLDVTRLVKKQKADGSEIEVKKMERSQYLISESITSISDFSNLIKENSSGHVGFFNPLTLNSPLKQADATSIINKPFKITDADRIGNNNLCL